MADDTVQESARDPRQYGVLAQFPTPDALMDACAKVRDEGFSKWDAHTPFPVHGLDGAMGLKRSWVSGFVALLGFSGAILGMLMQWWVASVAYPSSAACWAGRWAPSSGC